LIKESNKKNVIGIDIGGTNARIGLVSEDMSLSHFVKVEMNSFYNPNNPAESLRWFIENYINEILNIEKKIQINAIGIGFPSIISKDMTTVYSSPNLPGFNNINIVRKLGEFFGKPIFINNDVNMHLIYEIYKNNLKDKHIILGFYVGTGFGNSIFINGNFLQGKNGVAGELGHIPVFNNNKICSCGNIGCVETLASGKRLIELHHKYFSNTPFEEIFVYHSSNKVIDDFIECIAIPISTELNIFDPDCIILGGGVLQMKGFPMDILESKIKKYTRKPYPHETLQILYADDHQGTGVMGAGYYAFQNLIKNYKGVI
jgi:allose kinase